MKTILCVDDIRTNLLVLESLFEMYHNDEYKIITAISGEEALSVVLKNNIDLILLDIMMPGLDGYETAKLILSNKRTKDIPIIFLTAITDKDAISNCYNVGGVDYLRKPYNEQELLIRVKFHLDLKENEAKLKKEKKFAQDILDIQDNLIIVTDGISDINVNKEVLKFFNLKYFKEFVEKYGCIYNCFIEDTGYFNKSLVQDNKLWIEYLLEMNETDEWLVLMMEAKTLKLKSFTIKVKRFEDNYIISLTNITTIALKSKNFEHKAQYDGLTNIFNKAKFNKTLFYELNSAQNSEGELSLIIFDIDKFKLVNDTYGHIFGDEVLVKLTKVVKNHIRRTDVFARWGGEEFALLLPNIASDGAVKIAEHLRKAVEEEKFDEAGVITCSFGVTSYQDGDNSESITKRADKALYEAKNTGRNKVCQLS